ncbi:MAG: hypothetical protein U0166_03455 [Acidobacteriota bacterium]
MSAFVATLDVAAPPLPSTANVEPPGPREPEPGPRPSIVRGAMRAMLRGIFGALVVTLPVLQIAALGYMSAATRRTAQRGRLRGSLPPWIGPSGLFRRLFGALLLGAGLFLLLAGSQGRLSAPANPGAAGTGAMLALWGGLLLLWSHFKAGLRALVGGGLVLLPGSALIAINWEAGFINSFDRVDSYLARGPLLVLAGGALVMLAAAYLPMAFAHASVAEDAGAFLHFRKVLSLIGRRPLAYAALVGLSLLLSLPLHLFRAISLDNFGGAYLASALFFAALLPLKMLWASTYRKATEAAVPAALWRRVLAAILLVVPCFLYFFKLLVFQFILWHGDPGGHWEWFNHFLYLLPSPAWTV